jgi:hypothetical protein
MNSKIDKHKWDEVIANSDTPVVYALSWYLDIVSPKWEAYIYNDYKFVMPLPVKYRWGLPYLIQPPFCQKIGVFGIGAGNSNNRYFFRKLYYSFLYYNLQLINSAGLENRKYLNGRINYTLDLTPSYETLKKDYHENTIRNIKKAKNRNGRVQLIESSEYLKFFNSCQKGIENNQMSVFEKLVKELENRKHLKMYSVFFNGEITSAACFIEWNSCLLYLAGASSPKGQANSGMFLIFDHVISEFARSGFLLDFEGSMIPGVAQFFRGFGGKSSYYYHLRKIGPFYR